MSAYRYWRLTFTAQADVYVILCELELRASVGGANLAGSGTASASSTHSIHAISNVFDQNLTTYWHSGSTPQPHWIQYDFGVSGAQAVAEYLLTPYSPAYAPLAWYLLASNDGQYWTVADAKMGQSWAEGETKTLVLNSSLEAGRFHSSAATVIDASHYWIHSTVDRLGVPGRYPVRLYNRASGALLRESKSDATTGGYQFQFLPYLERGYQVIALDDPATRSDPKNAAIADLMTPEAMP